MSVKKLTVVKNDPKEQLIIQLKSSQFWSNYGIAKKTYIVQDIFDVKVTDNVLVYTITKDSTNYSYDLLIPYGEALHKGFLKQFLAFVDNVLNNYNIKIFITDTLRSIEEQLEVNNSPLNVIKGFSPTLSTHNVGLAIDFVPIIVYFDKTNKVVREKWITSKMKHYAWTIIGECLNKVGLKWGGDFSYYDPVHTQHPLSYALVEQIRQDNKKLISKLVNDINNTKIEMFVETNTKNRIQGKIDWL